MKMPDLEVYIRAGQGDPLAQIEVGEYKAHVARFGRVSRLCLIFSTVFLGWTIDLVYSDGLLEGLLLAMSLTMLVLPAIVWGVLLERYRPPPAVIPVIIVDE